MNEYEYRPSDIEKKWQDYWQKHNIYTVLNTVDDKENFYVLSEFAYPSGNLHVGHWYAFAVPDIYARYKRMIGYNVLYPIGFDAFGLPAENAAIKRGLDPRKWTYENMDYMKKQLISMGASFDWKRMIVTSNPEYYVWTQWMFNEFFTHGLVERSMTKTNWCSSCKTILANEQVVSGECERCENQVIQKDMTQWMLKITQFADELHDDLDTLNWNESIKQAQREWIGRKEGSEISFTLNVFDSKIDVFTTRADTLFGVTYVVLAPEHPLIDELKPYITNWDVVKTYITEVSKKTDLERQQSREKTGVPLDGVFVTNPINGEDIPVWIADYVLAHFGSGAVMAVPAHDERDAEFAITYDLPFCFVVLPSAGEIGSSQQLVTSGENTFIQLARETLKNKNPEVSSQDLINIEWNAMYDLIGSLDDGILPKGKRFCCTFKGKLINSPRFNAKTSKEAQTTITESCGAHLKKNYRLRDWGISRQRYWGCPIPIVYDPEGNPHPISREHLPWILPSDVDHTPDGTAPLARSEELKKRTVEIFGEGWTPEVDTMDTFVDSSWYFYRYLDSNNEHEFASQELLQSWMPVDMYFGGAEHTTMHLLYSRFWVKALHKIGYVSESEPYKARLNRGLILGPDGTKMSKSKGNVIDPDKMVSQIGADTIRLYLAFIGPFNEPGNYPWNPNGVVGVRRFLDRVWRLQNKVKEGKCDILRSLLHITIQKVRHDLDRLKLNTAISAMMIFINHAEKSECITQVDYDIFLQLLAPFAPHMCEELWMQSHNESIHISMYPEYDKTLIIKGQTEIPIQVNGKVRGHIMLEEEVNEIELRKQVLSLPIIQKWIQEKDVKKYIYVPNKIINIVIS